ncbi:MAG TPA: DUF402 domain-containing protein [Micromonosporaceae bacterium]|jgi:protein associated with RNAse G/E
MPSETVRVVYRKYDGSEHRDYPAHRLAEDATGTWLGIPTGTASIYHGRPSVERIPFVLFVPHDRWWTAMFNPPPRTSEVYCDIASPARWNGSNTVRLVDLDLDVVRRRSSGRVELLDEHEFADHRLRFGYPDELVGAARATAAWLVEALSDGTEPFASAYRPWLKLVV